MRRSQSWLYYNTNFIPTVSPVTSCIQRKKGKTTNHRYTLSVDVDVRRVRSEEESIVPTKQAVDVSSPDQAVTLINILFHFYAISNPNFFTALNILYYCSLNLVKRAQRGTCEDVYWDSNITLLHLDDLMTKMGKMTRNTI